MPTQIPHGRKKFRRDKVAGLCVFFGILLAFHLLWNLLPGLLIRDFEDPQYALKEERLRDLLSKNKDRPLWLVLGSSRVEDGFAAGVLNEGNGPLVFNFGLGGSDMFRQYICLRRLLADGIKPRRVGVEMMYPSMGLDESIFLTDPTFAGRARGDEITVSREFSATPGLFYRRWWRSRLDPYYIYFYVESQHFIKNGISSLKGRRSFPYDESGWMHGVDPKFTPEMLSFQFELETKNYKLEVTRDYKVSAIADKALRGILDLCRERGIEVFLLGMPESPRFRSLYAPEANLAAESYVARIQGEYGVPMIDARAWINEENKFIDGHHLVESGARLFSERLGEEMRKLPGGQ